MNEPERWVLTSTDEIRLWIPILVGLSALIFSTYQAYRVRRHYALTSRAFITPYIYAGDKEIRIGFNNTGPGHAIIDDTALYFEGHQIHETKVGEFKNHFDEFMGKQGISGKVYVTFRSISGDVYLPPGKKTEQLTVKAVEISQANMKKIQDIFDDHYVIVFLYHSIYRTRFRSVVGHNATSHTALRNKEWPRRKFKRLPDNLQDLLS